MSEHENHHKQSKLPWILYAIGVLMLCFCIIQLAVGPMVPLSEDADPNMTKRLIQLAEEGKLDLPEPWRPNTATEESDSERIRSSAHAFSAELARPIREEMRQSHKRAIRVVVPLAAIGLICTTGALVLLERKELYLSYEVSSDSDAGNE